MVAMELLAVRLHLELTARMPALQFPTQKI
jgi:hypothetical protein